MVVNLTLPGEIVTVPLTRRPRQKDLQTFAVLHAQGPDNLAFGRSGLLYVTLVTQDAIVALDAQGREVRRFRGPARDPNGDVAWDAPAGLDFDTAAESLLVVNHALVRGVADPSRFIVFDVYVADRPDPLERPLLP